LSPFWHFHIQKHHDCNCKNSFAKIVSHVQKRLTLHNLFNSTVGKIIQWPLTSHIGMYVCHIQICPVLSVMQIHLFTHSRQICLSARISRPPNWPYVHICLLASYFSKLTTDYAGLERLQRHLVRCERLLSPHYSACLCKMFLSD